MQKTKISWADYTINPVKGLCPMACKDNQSKPYCYACRMYKRFKWNPEIRWDYEAYHKNDFGLSDIKTPSRIFVGSTMELFGEWVARPMLETIFQITRRYPQHTFIFLTKKPENLIKYSPYPENVWVGASVTNAEMLYDALDNLYKVKSSVKFISFEPLLERVNGGECDDTYRLGGLKEAGISWLIIGCCTPVSPKTMCKDSWVEEIVNAADRAGIPIFIKPPLSDVMNLHREEMP